MFTDRTLPAVIGLSQQSGLCRGLAGHLFPQHAGVFERSDVSGDLEAEGVGFEPTVGIRDSR